MNCLILNYTDFILDYASQSVILLSVQNWIFIAVTAFLMTFLMAYLAGKRYIRKTQAVAWILFVTYLSFVFISTVYARNDAGVYQYRLQPFWSYREVFRAGRIDLLVENFLNVLLLLPIGILFPALSRKIKFRHTVALTAVISYTIEFSQLFLRRGLFELVDDPFHNVMGAVVGYCIYYVAEKKDKCFS